MHCTTYCCHHLFLAWTQSTDPSSDLMSSLPALAFALCPLPQLNGLEWGGEERNQWKRNKEALVSNFCSTQICSHFLVSCSMSPEPKAFLTQALSLSSVQSSLTLTVSSGREVEAASFPRATESGYFPRWNSAEIGVHSAGTRRGARPAPPDQGPLPTCYNLKRPSSLRQGQP